MMEEEMSRFIEELHSLFFCNSGVYDAQNTYQSLCYSFGLCVQVWLLISMNEASFETVCQCLTIAFHLSAVSYKHSFTQFIQALSDFSSFYLSSFSSVFDITSYH